MFRLIDICISRVAVRIWSGNELPALRFRKGDIDLVLCKLRQGETSLNVPRRPPRNTKFSLSLLKKQSIFPALKIDNWKKKKKKFSRTRGSKYIENKDSSLPTKKRKEKLIRSRRIRSKRNNFQGMIRSILGKLNSWFYRRIEGRRIFPSFANDRKRGRKRETKRDRSRQRGDKRIREERRKNSKAARTREEESPSKVGVARVRKVKGRKVQSWPINVPGCSSSPALDTSGHEPRWK